MSSKPFSLRGEKPTWSGMLSNCDNPAAGLVLTRGSCCVRPHPTVSPVLGRWRKQAWGLLSAAVRE